MTILESIVAHKRDEIAARKEVAPLERLVELLPGRAATRDFRAALVDEARPGPRVIAEVKRRSPSRGELRPDLDAVGLASIYEENGAAAISVLADNRFFGGSLDDLGAVSRAVSVPVLCKEFIIDPYQIYEARLFGADAVLLIAGILSVVEMVSFRELAAKLGMASLVEVHNRVELNAALDAGSEIIGINNRDLHTFDVSLDTTRNLLPLIPQGITTVSESGISTASDRRLMGELGIDALLIGESLLTSPDVSRVTREMCGVSSAVAEGSLR